MIYAVGLVFWLQGAVLQDGRIPVPTEDAQTTAERTIREVFKEEYAVRTSTAQQKLARILLQQGLETKDHDAFRYTLLREGGDVAAKAGDLETVLRCVDELSGGFQLDPLTLKELLLSKAGPSLRTPEDQRRAIDSYFTLAHAATEVDRFDTATKAAQAALVGAKKVKDMALVVRAEAAVRFVSESKGMFERAKKAEQILNTNPNDPAANLACGEYMCLSKGRWDQGLPHLSKGADGTLKALAEKDLKAPVQSAELAALADEWFDLAQKDKSSLRKGQMLARARILYERALPGSAGLIKVRIEKRLTEVAPVGTPVTTSAPVKALEEPKERDLLKLLNPDKDLAGNNWTLVGGALVSPATPGASRIAIPYIPPDEYDLELSISREAGGAGGWIGLVGARRQFELHFDAIKGRTWGLGNIDGKPHQDNETRRDLRVFEDETPRTVLCEIRKNRVRISVQGKVIIDWPADYGRVSTNEKWSVPDKRVLFLGSYSTSFKFNRLLLRPLSGPGKPLP